MIHFVAWQYPVVWDRAFNIMNVAIIDYQMGNLYSVKRACDKIGLNSEITSKKKLPEKIIEYNQIFLDFFCPIKTANQLNTYYQSPYSVPGATPGQDSNYSRSLLRNLFFLVFRIRFDNLASHDLILLYSFL